MDADRRGAMAACRRTQRGGAGVAGAGGGHSADDAAGVTRWRLGRFLRSALAADYGAGLSLRRRHTAGRAHRCRADAAGAAAGLHFRPGRRRGGADPGMAGHDARVGPTHPVAGGVQVGPGQRQPGVCGRTGAGRAGDRPPRWRPSGLRLQGCSRCLVRARSVLRAPAAGGIGSPPGAFPAGPARRRSLHLARTRRAPHPAPHRHVRRAGDGAVGAAAADRQPTLGLGADGFGALVRRVRPRRHCRRDGAGPGQGPAVQQRDARRRRPSLRGTLPP